MDRNQETKLAATANGSTGAKPSDPSEAKSSAEPAGPVDSVESLMKQGLYFWRAPTSLFVGLTAVNDPKAATKAAKAAKEGAEAEAEAEAKAKAQVYDPVEGGSIEVVFGEDDYTGVELRGAKKYTWTSVSVDTSGLKKAGRGYPLFETEAVNVKADSLDRELRRLCKNLRRRASMKPSDRPADDFSCFNKLQIDQLEEIQAGGATCKELLKSFNQVLKANPTRTYRLQARAYGGGMARAAVTFEKLVSEVVPWHRRAFASDVSVFCPSNGGADLNLDDSTKNALIGVEFVGMESTTLCNPGTPRYIRLGIADRSIGETYYTKHGFEKDLQSELPDACSTCAGDA